MNSFFASRQLWTCPHSFQTYMSGRVKQPLFKSVFYLMIVTYPLKPYAFWIKISFKLQAAFWETNELLCHLWSCPHTTAFGFFFFLLRQRQCLPWRLLLQRCLHSCFHKVPIVTMSKLDLKKYRCLRKLRRRDLPLFPTFKSLANFWPNNSYVTPWVGKVSISSDHILFYWNGMEF